MLNTLNVNLNTDLKVTRVPELGIKIKSQDINNNLFILRFTDKGKVIELDETYTVEILTKFEKSKAHRLTSATVYRDYARWEFDTSFITQDEKVTNYVYVRKSGSLVVSADANAFAFDVGLSEIDKDAGRVAEVYDENYQKYLDEFKNNVDFEEIAQAEQARKEAELLREENYNQKVDTAIVEADVVEKVDNKVTELTPQINDLTAQLAQRAHYVTPTGTGDDHDYLQNALNNYSSVVVKKGTYYVDTVKRLKPRSNQVITFEEGAIFNPLYNENGSSRLIFIHDVENVTIHNPTLIGDRDVLDSGSDGHGITISGTSKNIKVYDPSTSNFRGDGFAIYGGEDIYVSNLFSDNNRRMGLTITNGKNVTFDNPTCQNSNGGAPQAGIDIEPNSNTNTIENIVINNPIIKNNAGNGITIGLDQLRGVRHHVSITINNPKFYGNSFQVINLKDVPVPITGSIVFNNPEVYNARRTGFLLQDYSSENTPVIEVINPKIFNWNDEHFPSQTWGSGVTLIGSVKIGNINFYNVRLEENREISQTYGELYLNSTGGYDKINFFETNFKRYSQATGINFISNTGSDHIKINSALDDFGLNQKVTNIREESLNKVTIRATIPVSSFQRTYVNMGYHLVIEPRDCIILGLTNTPSQNISTETKGAYITIEKVSQTEYRVINMFGEWTVIGGS